MIGTLSALTSSLLTWNMFENLKKRVRLSGAADDGLPGVRVLEGLTLAIPVRNEESNLAALLPQLLAQSARPQRLLFLDDGSTDGTTFQLKRAAKEHAWIEVLRGEPLPEGEGWKGKVWALHQLLAQVRTPWVLFVDADVRFKDPGALKAIWSTAERQGVVAEQGFLSVFPRPEVTRRASILVHQIHTHLYYFMPNVADRFKIPQAVAGCGQMMFVPVAEWRGLGGFARIRATTHDGLQMARLFKAAGARVVAADGDRYVSALTYPDFWSAFRGFTRNDFEATGSKSGAVMLSFVLFQVFVMPFLLFPCLFLHPLWLASFSWLMYGQHRMAQEFGLGKTYVLFTPLAATASIGVHLWSQARSSLGLKVQWRGRRV